MWTEDAELGQASVDILFPASPFLPPPLETEILCLGGW